MATADSKKPSNTNKPSESKAPAAKAVEVNVEAQAKAAQKVVSQASDEASKVISLSAEAVREFWTSGAEEFKQIQKKAIAFSRESGKTFSKSSETMARNVNEALDVSRENLEAAVESANAAADASRFTAEELYNFANEAFAKNIEHSKAYFGCRTLNDFIELNNEYFSSNVDALFNQSLKLTNLMFKYANEAAEPIQGRVADTTQKLNKALAA